MAKKNPTNTDLFNKLEENKKEFAEALEQQNKYLRNEIAQVGKITAELQEKYNELTTWRTTTMAASQAAKQAVDDYKKDHPEIKPDRGSINQNLLEVVKFALVVAAAALGAKVL